MGGEPGVCALVNIPNALTLARIILVPLIVWLIITHEIAAAFVLFLLAGLSDAASVRCQQAIGLNLRPLAAA